MSKRSLLLSVCVGLSVAIGGCSRHASPSEDMAGNTTTATDLEGVQATSPMTVSPLPESDGQNPGQNPGQNATFQNINPTQQDIETDELLPSNDGSVTSGNSTSAGHSTVDGAVDEPITPEEHDSEQDQNLVRHRTHSHVSNEEARRNITVGTAVQGASSENRNEAKAFVPASITKLITTGVALEMLGPDFTFKHIFSFQMDSPGRVSHFKWTSDGDPTLGHHAFEKNGANGQLRAMVSGLKEKGVQIIKGPIEMVASDPRLENRTEVEGVAASDRASCFGTYVYAFNVNHNCGVAKRDPKAALKSIFIRELATQGISYQPNAIGTSSGVREKVEFSSPPLREILIPMDKTSDNFLADALFRAAASRVHGTHDIASAGQALYRVKIAKWMKVLGTPELANELKFIDGAGLSRNNSATPRAYLQILRYYVRQDYFPVIWKALPIAGVDGTIAGRMRGPDTRGIVRAKTGTVIGYYQLAGYIPRLASKNGDIKDFVPFVVLTESPGAYKQAAHNYQDEIVTRLAQTVN